MGDAVIGLIGMGDMGMMYARRLSEAGWRYGFSPIVRDAVICATWYVLTRFLSLPITSPYAMMT